MAAVEIPFVDEPELPEDPMWVAKAACKGQTHLFFARRAERPQARARREAKARDVCLSCPVMTACRDTARALREYGFWGAESEEERHRAGYTLSVPLGVRERAS